MCFRFAKGESHIRSSISPDTLHTGCCSWSCSNSPRPQMSGRLPAEITGVADPYTPLPAEKFGRTMDQNSRYRRLLPAISNLFSPSWLDRDRNIDPRRNVDVELQQRSSFLPPSCPNTVSGHRLWDTDRTFR